MPVLMVTGASGGIGRAVMDAARNDWDLVAVTRKASEIPRWEGLHSHEADVTVPEQVTGLFDALARDDRLPDALIHCVGSTLIAPLDRVAPNRVEEVLRVNLLSSIFVLAQFVGRLREQRLSGSAVLFSSVVSGIGVANHEVIAAAKGGVEGLARAAAATYAGSGIRINVLAPGLTDTPLAAPLLANDASRTAAARQYPLAGINAPADVAAAALWLVSPQAARITGQVIPVDGGFTAIRPLVR